MDKGTEQQFPGKNPNWQKVGQMQYSGRTQVAFPTQLDMVAMFHVLSGLPVGNLKVRAATGDIQRRINIIDEEVNKELLPNLEKLKSAYNLENLALVLDDLVDSVYVILGTAVELGLPFDTAFMLVQEANLQKVKDVVIRRKDGKILKPEGWQPPKVLELVKMAHAGAIDPGTVLPEPDQKQ